jgi:hypothetical protein
VVNKKGVCRNEDTKKIEELRRFFQTAEES